LEFSAVFNLVNPFADATASFPVFPSIRPRSRRLVRRMQQGRLQHAQDQARRFRWKWTVSSWTATARAVAVWLTVSTALAGDSTSTNELAPFHFVSFNASLDFNGEVSCNRVPSAPRNCDEMIAAR